MTMDLTDLYKDREWFFCFHLPIFRKELKGVKDYFINPL